MTSSVDLTYIGQPAYAGALATEFQSAGLVASYDPPMETKDLATAMSAVAVAFSVTGSIPDIVECVRKFRSRFSGTQVEGLPESDGRTIDERLAELDRLLADGAISEDERAEQRRRILKSL